jgi:integrase
MRNLDRPGKADGRNRVLSDGEIAKFWAATETLPQMFGAALKLLLLTGQRREEVGQMTWSELNADFSLWSLSGARTKNKLPHVVPLPPAAREIIAGVIRISDTYVFPSNTGVTPISGWSKCKSQLDQAMGDGVPPWRVHDLRRTCVTGMAEIGVRPDVIELVVNHRSGHRGGIAGVYNKAEMMPERRAALEAWERRVVEIVEGKAADNVVPLRGREAAQ